MVKHVGVNWKSRQPHIEKRRKTDGKGFGSPLYIGVRDVDFEQIQGEIDRYNREVFPKVNAVGAVAMLVLLAVAALMGENGPLKPFVWTLVAFCALFAALQIIPAGIGESRSHKAILVYTYATVLTLYALTICLGPISDTHQLSMTFLVLLFAMPILIADAPVRIAIVSVIASAVFVLASYLNKEPALFVYDAINCATFLAASIVVEFNVQKMRLNLFMKLKQTEHERDTDGLTNVWAKKSGEQRVRDRIEQHPNAPGTLVLMDIDDFKQVNDKHGHDHGDLVLRTVGTVLNESFRKDDILVRFGGDEFMFYLSGVDTYQEVRDCVRRIRASLEEESEALLERETISCSFGAAFYPENGEEYADLLRRADKALYLAKNLGKNKLRFYQREE